MKVHRVPAVAAFLIVAVLVAGAMACDAARTCQRTISSNSGGNVTTPGEVTFPYQAGTVVSLVATLDDGYGFRSWTGDITSIADPNAASTTITMNGNYAIVANFERGRERLQWCRPLPLSPRPVTRSAYLWQNPEANIPPEAAGRVGLLSATRLRVMPMPKLRLSFPPLRSLRQKWQLDSALGVAERSRESQHDCVGRVRITSENHLTIQGKKARLNNSSYYYMTVRKTKQREAILKVLRGTTSHPTADWIYEEVRKDIPNISLGTVYRNLRLLRESGEVLGIDTGGASARFNGNASNHYHFRCERCGRIFDIDEPVDEEINQRIARRTGFKISAHWLEFRGLCRDCQRAQ